MAEARRTRRVTLIRPGTCLELQDSGPTVLEGHDHESVLVSVLLSPSVRVEREDGRKHWEGRFSWGDVGVYPPGLVRQVRWHDAARIAHLHLAPSLFADVESGQDAPRVDERTRIQDPLLRELVLAIVRHEESPAPNNDLVFDALLDALVAHLRHAHTGTGRARSRRRAEGGRNGELTSEALSRLDDFIHASLEETLTIAHLAEVVGLPRKRFARLFKHRTGQTPYQHVLSLRVEAALAMIREGGSPASVALRTGFYDQSHLARHFKRHLGVTPGDVRRLAL